MLGGGCLVDAEAALGGRVVQVVEQDALHAVEGEPLPHLDAEQVGQHSGMAEEGRPRVARSSCSACTHSRVWHSTSKKSSAAMARRVVGGTLLADRAPTRMVCYRRRDAVRSALAQRDRAGPACRSTLTQCERVERPDESGTRTGPDTAAGPGIPRVAAASAPSYRGGRSRSALLYALDPGVSPDTTRGDGAVMS